LAARILQEAGVDRAKLPGEYLELLKLLGGHPLSLRVVLRHLKTQSPVQLIEALRRGLDTFKGAEEEGREKSLTVSLDYSFANLSERARQHLPFLGLFCDRVNAHWLDNFSANPDSDWGQAYRAVFGENLQESDWIGLLNEATAAGILEDLGETIYKIHPALPWYLRQQLDKMGSQEVITNLEKKLLGFYVGLAHKYCEKLISNAEQASFVLQVEEPNLLQQLRLAEKQQDWAYAQAILQPLDEVYRRWGRKPELKSLRERALKHVGINLAEAKSKGKDAFNFWMQLRLWDGNEAAQGIDLDKGRAVYQEILDELTALNDPSVNDKIGAMNNNLGHISQKQRRFDAAEAFFKKAILIFEGVGDFYSAIDSYHNLGILSEEQRRFDEAKDFYCKALDAYESAGDYYSAAGVYYHLGRLAQAGRNFEEAKIFYQKSLQIYENARDFHKAASNYHHLGMLAQQQRSFEEAKVLYNKSLQIYEDDNDFLSAAIEYNQLGNIAKDQRQFDEAKAYYNKALEIYEDLRDFHKAASQYHNLGMVAEEQRHFDNAKAFYQKSLHIYQDEGDFYKAASDYNQLGKIAYLQSNFEEAKAFYQDALLIYKKEGDSYSVAREYHNLGLVAEEQQCFDEAKTFYQKTLLIFEGAGDFYVAANTYVQLGEIAAREKQDYVTAMNYYKKALEQFIKFSDWRRASLTLRKCGKLLEATSNWTDALQIYIRTLAIDVKHDEELIVVAIADLGRMLKHLGDSQFQVIWQEENGYECPVDFFSAIQEASSIDPN
jgi:tetratricopeptide (TPR) repeat protein